MLGYGALAEPALERAVDAARGRMVGRMSIENVQTPRLRGEALGTRHLDLLAPVFADPRVGRTMGGVMDRETVAGMLAARRAAAGPSDGLAYWMFFETATGEPVARGGLSHTVFDGADEIEVGWTTFPDRWGEGFATEVGAGRARGRVRTVTTRQRCRVHAPT